ncbi:MAG: helix-turn-helix domain-containing protein [Kangiellaceae bacterium]|nr:helix-turn-helix domain-containing protein [Kangiellaceae bacterium]
MKIGLTVFPGCVVSGLIAFAEMIEVANKRCAKKIFEIQWVGVNLEPVPVTMGNRNVVFSITPQTTIVDSTLTAILLPGYWTDAEGKVNTANKTYSTLLSALKQLPKDTGIWSYCSSVSLLAETGRLDGKEATSTWWLEDYLQQSYPQVNWRFTQTCIFEIQNTTASGVNGYLPIAEALISEFCGQQILRDIIDLMVIPRPETSNHPFQNISLIRLKDPLMRQIYVWVEGTPATELTISKLAKALNQTERSLSRKVKTNVNLSCAHFMRSIKMHQASEHLIYSSAPINVIGERLGFSDDAAFRRTFKKVSSYTPSNYRQTFKR